MILLLSIVTPLFSVASASDDNSIYTTFVDGNPITSKAAIVIDFLTGLVIYEFNADELRVPASMVKMIAVYVVLDAIENGLINFDTQISTTRSTSIFSYNRAFSNVPMPRGSSYTVRELLDVVIVRSACAATIALGEGIFGNEAVFVSHMNRKVEDLGIEATFFDSWGGSRDNRMSARGMAELTKSLINSHPIVLELTSQAFVTFDDIEYRTTNPLLTGYYGVDGFKTGYTNPAGWCFTSTAKQNNRRIITVTMGSESGFRFPDTVVLLDYGFKNYSKVIANLFRSSLQSPDFPHFVRSPLVPIRMYKIDEARYFDILDIAVMLNET